MTTHDTQPATPLNEVIVQKASQLFRQQGYTATSIKQIAKAAGCTNAALYYYFEGGKKEILHEVIRHTSQERVDMLSTVATANSLEELLIQFSQTLAQPLSGMASRINWLMLEFASLPAEEQALLHSQLIDAHTMIQAQIGRFVADEERANRLAWLVFCSFFGYRQIFDNIGMGQIVEMSMEDYGQFLAQTIAASD